jgi:hypothetical protein
VSAPRFTLYRSPRGGALLAGDDALYAALAVALHQFGPGLAGYLRALRDALDDAYIGYGTSSNVERRRHR